MFLYWFLIVCYLSLCFMLMGIILIQKSKGSLGIGNIGGSMQMLFGGSGGQSLLQKVTWGMGSTFMLLSLVLALMKSSNQQNSSRYIQRQRAPIEQSATQQSAPTPAVPAAPSSSQPIE